jgi:hypothetical protein
MADVLYFGIGLDDDGYFYAVGVGDRTYKACDSRYATLEEATQALTEVIERARIKVEKGGWLN